LKVALPSYDETIAPCFEYSATISIFALEEGAVVDRIDFVLQSQLAMDRVRLLLDQGVETLICGGIQDKYEELIRAKGIRVLSWVSGSVDALLAAFQRGELEEGRRGDTAGSETGEAPRTGANP